MLCGSGMNATVLEPSGSGVSLCYRSVVYLGLPTLFGLGGYCFALVQEMKVRKKKTMFPITLAARCIGVVDWLRLLIFFFTGIAPTVFYFFERSQWETETQEMPPYKAIELFLMGIFLWIVLACSWILHEVRRGSEEWFWLRFFTFITLIGESLRFWSELRNLDEDYADKNHRDFAVLMGTFQLTLKFLAFFVMVCFNRNWRELRASLRTLAHDNGLREHLINVPNESFVESADIGSNVNEFYQSEAGSYMGSESKLPRTPEQYAGLLSRLLFFWLEPIMIKGSTKELEEGDFYKLLREDEVQLLSRNFSEAFKAAKAEKEAKDREETARVADINSDGYAELSGGDVENEGSEGDIPAADAEESAEAKAKRKKALDEQGSLSVMVKGLHRAGILTPFYHAAFYKFVYDSLMFVSPQLLRLLITYLTSEEDEPTWKGYFYVGLMFATAACQTFVLHVYFHKVFRAGMRVRSALLTTVYRKSLRLTPSARQKRTTGEVVNLMSTDCERLNMMFPYLHVTWSSPYQVILSLIFLWRELKFAVFVAVFVIFMLMTPLTALVAGKIKEIQKKLMKVKDNRIRATGEAITAIKVIKLYGWERTFRHQVAGARDEELALLRTYVIWRAFARTLWAASPVVVTLCTFAAFIAMGGTLDAATAFTSLSLLNLLRFPLSALPQIISSAVEAGVSLRRISSFLESEELDLKALESSRKSATMPDKTMISISNGTFFWDDKFRYPAVRNINLDVTEGDLVVVTGEVGSGKSALLQSLIGELQPAGTGPQENTVPLPLVGIRGSIAYAAQVPWIQNATLRDNILFGAPYDRDWYNHVIFACSLTPDLDQLPDGDATEIGERGINLSGGQKARVALARAVYSRADILLLETCFEAVDEHVGAFLWKHCFNGILKEINPTTGRKRTVLLVTHALKYVHDADLVLVMKGGTIAERGKYDDIASDPSSELARLSVRVERIARERKATEDGQDEHGDAEAYEGRVPLQRKKSSFRKGWENKSKGNLTGKEERAVGEVSWDVYKQYMSAVGGPFVVGSVVLGLFVRTALDTATSAWLAYWSSNSKKKTTADAVLNATSAASSALTAVSHRVLLQGSFVETFSSSPLPFSYGMGINFGNETSQSFSDTLEASSTGHSTGFYLGIYTAFSVGSLLFIAALTLYIAMVALTASRTMHSEMLNSVCRAPMAFFDTTPIGRILNRFSKEIYTIDETLPESLYSFLSTLFTVFGTIATISGVTPPFLATIPFLFFAYLRIQRYYIATSRQVKRWDAVLRSPIYSHFSESLDGVTTIRAYNVSRRFIRQNQHQLESQLGTYYISIAINRWLAVRLEFIGTCLVLFTSLFVVLLNGDRNAAFGALAISYSLNITQTLNWTVRMSSEVENNIISVERVNEYIKLKPEASEDAPDPSKVPRPEEKWPSEGRIVFRDVRARYRPGLEEVLRGVSFTVLPGEKVGIVGRTGSGKSTLFLLLLRLIEPSEGSVIIDGVDAHDLGLEQLRQSCAVIPQDPVMFSASLRKNLDPMDLYTDEEIWRALEITQLKKHVESLVQQGDGDMSPDLAKGNPLETMITEGGGNFSFGQRQLICIARAVLRRCKIILLDEATSGIDAASDEHIQNTIRSEFKSATVLTIAHRLTTISDGDKILVMDAGKVAEFDSPKTLLSNKNSLFNKLVEQMKKHDK